MSARMVLGSELSPAAQRDALARFVHRFTRDHRPNWVNGVSGRPTVQFASDADWLANTRFAVTKSGRLHRGVRHCESRPTWPDNPELRNS